MSSDHSRAGGYARDRYRDGLRRYRRRTRSVFLVLIGSALGLCLVFQAVWGLDWWSYIVGMTAGGLIALAAWVHDDPPEFIAKWGRGAEGEEKTGVELQRLVSQGWSVRHDVELPYGNADHIVLSPSRRAYVLETKTLAGSISLEYGRLTCRFADDPDEVRRYDLVPQLERTTSAVRNLWRERATRDVPNIDSAVVIWGALDPAVQSCDGLSYVRGDVLVAYLLGQEPEQPAT